MIKKPVLFNRHVHLTRCGRILELYELNVYKGSMFWPALKVLQSLTVASCLTFTYTLPLGTCAHFVLLQPYNPKPHSNQACGPCFLHFAVVMAFLVMSMLLVNGQEPLPPEPAPTIPPALNRRQKPPPPEPLPTIPPTLNRR
jgi:hypothetical protein